MDRRAEKDLAAAPDHVVRRFARALEALAADPLRPRPGLDVKALKGTGLQRLRLGAWRVLIAVDEKTKVVRVLTASPRERAYE